jgi:hypothetical protein
MLFVLRWKSEDVKLNWERIGKNKYRDLKYYSVSADSFQLLLDGLMK